MIHVAFKGQSFTVPIQSECTLAHLRLLLQSVSNVGKDCSIKLLMAGRKAISLKDEPQRSVGDAGDGGGIALLSGWHVTGLPNSLPGIKPGSRVMMLATSLEAVQKVSGAEA